MTANELADNLEEWVSPRTVEQAVTMLRQRQAEIEAWKEELKRYAEQMLQGDGNE